MLKFKIPAKIKHFASLFKNNGFQIFIVGGAVRDYILNKKNDDYDFATDAMPQDVQKIFYKVIPTGLQHGTVTVLFQGESYEVTTFRTESNYSDNRHPDSVKFVSTLEEDLSRRDFTVNALACDCNSGEIIDYNNGIEDLKKGVIRAIGNPYTRFNEDALRMLRAFRFSAKLGFQIDDATYKAVVDLSKNILNVSAERIKDELVKTVCSDYPEKGLMEMKDSGLMQYILPELVNTVGVKQDRMHKYDVFEHTLRTVKATAKLQANSIVRLAALFHDIGKPQVQGKKDGHFTFFQHEIVGADLTYKIMNRLKFSTNTRDKVVNLVNNHMFFYTPDWSDGAVKRFINRVGKENLIDLFELRKSDHLAILEDLPNLLPLEDRIKELENQPLTLKDLSINGVDLMQEGIPRNKILGILLKELLEFVIDDPTINTKDQLLKIAKQRYNYYNTKN